MQFLASLLLFITPLTRALPTAVENIAVENVAVEERACYAQCGSNCYSSSQVSAALRAGYGYTQKGTTAGGSTYPHVYNNYEGFDFPVSGTYYEFPLKTSGVYTGGSPGADRIIYNSRGQEAGAITHTGASGNNFVACG